MGERQAVQVHTLEGLKLPQMRDLFARAFAGAGPSAQDAMSWLEARIENDDLGVFVSLDGDEFSGLSIIMENDPVWSGESSILHFYSDGGSDGREAMVEAANDWAQKRGLRDTWIINRTGRSDAVHMRLFGKTRDAKVLGSVIMYEVL